MSRCLATVVVLSLLGLTAGVGAAMPEQTRWLGRSERNGQVELTVFDVAVAQLPDRPGRSSVRVATAWRNIAPPHRLGDIEWKTTGVGSLSSFGRAELPRGRAAVRHTPYLVPRLSDHVYLMHGVGGVARLDDDAEIRLARQDDEVEWQGRFEIATADADALLLVFFDFDHGHIRVPLTDRVPPREGSTPVSEAGNDYLRVRVYGSRPHGAALEVEVGLLSVSAGNAVEVELAGAVGLLLSDGSVVEPSADGAARWFDGVARILPDWEQRADFRFDGAAHGGAGVLEIALPGQPPLQLPLDHAATGAPPVAAAVLYAWEDGEGLRLELLQAAPDPQGTALLVRVRVLNHCGSDLTFAPTAQFPLLIDGRQVSATATAGEDPDAWVVRDGATRMLTLRYPLRRLPAKAQINYRGFETDTPVPVEVNRR